MMSRKYLRRVVPLCLVLIAAIVLLYGFVRRQDLYDWWRLRNYTPPAAVSQLAADTTMNPVSQKVFYVHRPLLSDKEAFNGYCRRNEQTIVLGCYISGEGIYLLTVNDERLNGIHQVTAAHEVLHALYDRLSKPDREWVDAMVQSAFESVTDQRIISTVELYRKENPAIVPNELHSILATEVKELPADLEAYYARYFTDRRKIVDFSNSYEQAFVERKNQIIQYDAQLAALKEHIDVLQAKVESESSFLDSERSRLNKLQSQNKVDEYNAAIPAYNARANAYNKDIDSLRSLISQYNEIVPMRNAIAQEEQELVQAIDSRSIVPDKQ